jgi:hypothetical protein
MRCALAAALLATAALAACEGTKVRLQNPHPPGTPAYEYDEAFYSFKYNHKLFQRLQGAPQGQQGTTMDDIVKNLEIMKGLLADPLPAQLQPLIDSHRQIQKDFVERGAVNAGVFMALDNLHRKVDAAFYPECVKLKAVPAPAPGTPAAPAPATAPAAGATAMAPAAAPAVAPSPAVPGWMAATAWRKAHENLTAAWPGKPAEAAAAFAQAREALAAAKASASEEAAPSLQIYLNEYDRLAAQTASFSKVPEGQTAEGVAKALGAIAKGVETHLPK